MKPGLKIAIWTGIAIFVTGAIYAIQREIKLLKSYCWKITHFTINDFTLKKLDIDLNVSIRNISNIDITIIGYSIKIDIDGRYIGNVVNNVPLYVPANDLTTTVINFNTNPYDVLDLQYILAEVKKFQTDTNNIQFRMYGSATVQKGIKISVPFDLTMSYADMQKTDPNLIACKI